MIFYYVQIYKKKKKNTKAKSKPALTHAVLQNPTSYIFLNVNRFQ